MYRGGLSCGPLYLVKKTVVGNKERLQFCSYGSMASYSGGVISCKKGSVEYKPGPKGGIKAMEKKKKAVKKPYWIRFLLSN